MTAPTPAGRVATDLRRGHIYGYLTLAHDDRASSGRGGVVEFGYGGQSFQKHGRRDGQHRDCQPWEDLIVGSPVIIADGWWTPDELDAIERAVIRGQWAQVKRLAVAEATRRGADPDLSGMLRCRQAGERPRYNWACNEDNERQVPKWVAVEQRWARDDAAGVPRWVPLEERAQVGLVPPATLRLTLGQRLSARARAVALRVWLCCRWWVCGWLAAFVAAAAGLWLGVGLAFADSLVPASAAATGLLVWVRRQFRPRRRAKRPRQRRSRRR